VRKLFLFKGEGGREEECDEDKTDNSWKRNAVE
jgi:hypothetical protein